MGGKRREDDRRPVPPGSDPVWTCPVSGCPGHVQRPWFSYRPVPAERIPHHEISHPLVAGVYP